MSDIGQPIVIGQGSFGCVHKPQMKCEGKNRTDASIVSKLMKRNDANDELKERGKEEERRPNVLLFLLYPPNLCHV